MVVYYVSFFLFFFLPWAKKKREGTRHLLKKGVKDLGHNSFQDLVHFGRSRHWHRLRHIGCRHSQWGQCCWGCHYQECQRGGHYRRRQRACHRCWGSHRYCHIYGQPTLTLTNIWSLPPNPTMASLPDVVFCTLIILFENLNKNELNNIETLSHEHEKCPVRFSKNWIFQVLKIQSAAKVIGTGTTLRSVQYFNNSLLPATRRSISYTKAAQPAILCHRIAIIPQEASFASTPVVALFSHVSY